MSTSNPPGVSTRVLDYGEETRKVWNKDFSRKPPMYEFSGGRKFYNADEDGCGVYGTAADHK